MRHRPLCSLDRLTTGNPHTHHTPEPSLWGYQLRGGANALVPIYTPRMLLSANGFPDGAWMKHCVAVKRQFHQDSCHRLVDSHVSTTVRHTPSAVIGGFAPPLKIGLKRRFFVLARGLLNNESTNAQRRATFFHIHTRGIQ